MRITKLHLIVILLIFITGGIWVYNNYRDIGFIDFNSLVETIKSKFPKKPAVDVQTVSQPEHAKPEEDSVKIMNDANEAITVAKEMLQKAYDEGRDIKLPIDTLTKSQDSYDGGYYRQSWTLARQAIEEIRMAQIPSPPVKPETPAVSAAGQRRGTTYIVKRGDTLWHIAKKSSHYGLGSKWVRIWRANEKDIPDFDTIHPGQEIYIPED